MKKGLIISLFAVTISLTGWAFFGTQEDFETAENLASQGIIVDRESIDEYNLTSYVLRQEVIGIALKLANIHLPEDYVCKGYFVDATFAQTDVDSWVCRAVELAADQGIISRRLEMIVSERKTRPHATVTRSEALAMLLQAAGISIDRSVSSTLLMQPWQYQVMYTAHAQGIVRNYPDPENNAQYFGVNAQATRSEVFAYAQAILQITQPNNCIEIGEYAGGGFVAHPEDPADFVCCTGLTKVQHKDSYMISDLGNVCANTTDGICDSNFESWYNSPDCEKPIDTGTCESYYDGCNWCHRSTLDGPAACTERACFQQEPAYCNACLDGYVLEDGACVLERELDTTGCSAYYDGCNSCNIEEDGLATCTLRFCAQQEPGYCTACQDGYSLKDGSCQKDIDTKEVSYNLNVCSDYYDGCNTCQVEDGVITGCTKVQCIQSERPYCIDHIYTIRNYEDDTKNLSDVDENIREYLSDLTCTDDSQCKVVAYGYQACGGPTEYLTYSRYTINSQALFDQVADYKKMLQDFTEAYELVSTCQYIVEPDTIACEYGKCVAR